MQDTGFGNALPLGEGLFAFDDRDSAAAAIDEINRDYERHRRGAHEIAREFFNYDVVLTALLDHAGVDVPVTKARKDLVTFPPPELPDELRLTAESRHPLRLPAATVDRVLHRPVPRVVTGAVDTPTVTIAVATFGQLPVTRMCLESVLVHTEGPYEIVVVDNGSTDGTAEYLSVLAARNRNVRVIANDENRGFAAATNQAMTVARGRVLVLLNNDTIVTPGWLEALAAALDDPAVGLVGPATNRCGNEAEIATRYETYGDLIAFARTRTDTTTEPVDLPVVVMFCAAMRRDTFETVGPLDERFTTGMFEDDDYSLRVRAAGLRTVFDDRAFVHHFGEATLGALAPDGRLGELFHTNRARFEEKWGRPWEPHGRRLDDEYEAVIAGVRRALDAVAPPGRRLAVVSKGDPRLVTVPGRRASHFPGEHDGEYRGWYPADDVAAISELEAARGAGEEFFVIPAPLRWWLDHYPGLAAHLQSRYRLAADDETCVVFDLAERQ